MSSLTSGRLRYAMAELAGLPRAAVVVEDRYSQVFALQRVRPAQVADGLAELQVRWPGIPLVFCDTRKLAEEWTYRYLAAAFSWAEAEQPALERMGLAAEEPAGPAAPPAPAREIREWARATGLTVSDRGRLPAPVVQAWQAATGAGSTSSPSR